MMLSEIGTYLAHYETNSTPPRQLIIELNVLDKSTNSTRLLTFRHLNALYAIDSLPSWRPISPPTCPNGKRTRCAMVKAEAQTSYLQVPWSWNKTVSIAAATGARSFYASYEYAHGGISPQECVLPTLEITGGGVQHDVSITQAKWQGLRLRVEVAGGADLPVDLRLGAETSGPTLLKGGRVLNDSGRTAFLVTDEHEGKAACMVVLDDDGRVLAHRIVTIGED